MEVCKRLLNNSIAKRAWRLALASSVLGVVLGLRLGTSGRGRPERANSKLHRALATALANHPPICLDGCLVRVVTAIPRSSQRLYTSRLTRELCYYMEEHFWTKALLRDSREGSTHKAKPLKKHRKHLGRLEKSQRMWMARVKKFRSTRRIKQMFYEL
jgi:hypothetical protein